MRVQHLLPALVLGGVSLGAAPEALAQTVCVPDAIGVPGLSGPPDWEDTAQDWFTRAFLPSDPRWRGAASIDYGTTSTTTPTDASFRFLWESPDLYLSWYLKSPPHIGDGTTGPAQTTFFVGIAPNTNDPSDALILRFQVQELTTEEAISGAVPAVNAWTPKPASDGANTYFDIDAFEFSGGSWSIVTDPAWVANTARLWLHEPSPNDLFTIDGVASGEFNDPGYADDRAQAALQLRIENLASLTKSDGTPLGIDPTQFKMWHYTQVELEWEPGLTAIVPFTYPRFDTALPASCATDTTAADCVDHYDDHIYFLDASSFPPQHSFPDLQEWGLFSTATPGSLPPGLDPCSGVSLSRWDQIGSTGTPPSEITFTGSNTLFASPENFDLTPVPTGTLEATFRFANWGSQVGDETATSWQSPIPTVTMTSVLPGATAGPPVTPGTATVNTTWTLNQQQRCMFDDWATANPADCAGEPAPTLRKHQCMLVELNGPGVNFMRNSVYRNMDFVGASTFTRLSDISVAGLEETPAGERDVYLYVTKENLPEYAFEYFNGDDDDDPKLSTTKTPPSQQPSQSPPVPPAGGQDDDEGNDDAEEIVLDKKIVTHATTVPQKLVLDEYDRGPVGGMTGRLIVRAYHDTGVDLTVDENRISRLLLPQTSYGYVVTHEGGMEGWKTFHEGTEQSSVNENLYRVAAPDGGAATIEDVIIAIEPKRWSIAFLGGVMIPNGSLATTQSTGLGGRLSVEYFLQSHHALTVEAGLGQFSFGSGGGAGSSLAKGLVTYRLYLGEERLRPYGTLGLGGYQFGSGSVQAGGMIGAGAHWLFSHTLGLDVAFNFHSIPTEPVTTYSDVQAGLRLRF